MKRLLLASALLMPLMGASFSYADDVSDAQAALDAKTAARAVDAPKLFQQNHDLMMQVASLKKQIADLQVQLASAKQATADAIAAGKKAKSDAVAADDAKTPTDVATAIKQHTLIMGMTLVEARKSLEYAGAPIKDTGILQQSQIVDGQKIESYKWYAYDADFTDGKITNVVANFHSEPQQHKAHLTQRSLGN